MNAATPTLPHGYGAQITRTDRDTEYDAFARVTRVLRKAVANDNRIDMIEAVDRNNQLWTILATDLISEGNALPNEVKAGLLSLADFVLRHGKAVMYRNLPAEVLIDINMSIMKGLRGECQS